MFVSRLLNVPADIFSFGLSQCKKLIATKDFATCTTQVRQVAQVLFASTWNSVDLWDYLCFAESGPVEHRVLLTSSIDSAPDFFCIYVASKKTSDQFLHLLFKEIIHMFIVGQHPSSSLVLSRISTLNQASLLDAFSDFYSYDQSNVSRILDIAHELKLLALILSLPLGNFVLDVASLASRRQHLNLEKWLNEHVKKSAEQLEKCIEFLALKAGIQMPSQGTPLSPETVQTFVRFLRTNLSFLPQYLVERLSVIQRGFVSDQRVTTELEDPSQDIQFPENVEDEVNHCFERLFSHDLGVPELLSILSEKRLSSSSKDQNFFACLIHNLFDEYRFIPKYPENELLLTASLFGGIINEQLISNVPLSVALKYVLEALKKPPGQKLFKFGIHALLQFQQRFQEWPEFCNLLLHIHHLHQVHPDLVSYIRHCLSSSTKKDASSSGAGSVPLFKGVKMEFTEPSEAVRERCMFIINNLSLSNMSKKIEELSEILKRIDIRWLSFYIVSSRACIEPTLHPLFIAFIEGFEVHNLETFVLAQTYKSINAALSADIPEPTSSDRSALRNLGSWLGYLTLARDRPILHRELSLKTVLADSFASGKLALTLPFVCKVFEQSVNSFVFRPFNPWLMNHLKVLAELYYFSDMKLNMKFEIEVLCKNLGLDIKTIEPAFLLRQHPLGLPKSIHGVPALREISLPLKSTVLRSQAIVRSGFTAASLSLLTDITAIAVEFALRELSIGVADRSIGIARSTTQFFIGKELSDIHDANLFAESAVAIFLNLSKSLALVTSKEPLRQVISSNISTFLANSHNFESSDQLVATLSSDNLELACNIIVEFTGKRAEAELAQLLARAFFSAPSSAKFPSTYIDFSMLHQPMQGISQMLPLIAFDPILPQEFQHIVEQLKGIRISGGSHAPQEAETDNERLVKTLFEIISSHPDEKEHQGLHSSFTSILSENQSLSDEQILELAERILGFIVGGASVSSAAFLISLLSKVAEFSVMTRREIKSWIANSGFLENVPAASLCPLVSHGILSVTELDAFYDSLLSSGSILPETVCSNIAALLDASVCRVYDFALSLRHFAELPGEIQGCFDKEESHAFIIAEWNNLLHSQFAEKQHVIAFLDCISASLNTNARLCSLFQAFIEASIEHFVKHTLYCRTASMRFVDNFGKLVTAMIARSFDKAAGISGKDIGLAALRVCGVYLVKAVEQRLINLYVPLLRFFKGFCLLFCYEKHEIRAALGPVFTDFLLALSSKSSLVLFNFKIELLSNQHFCKYLLTDKKNWGLLAELLKDVFSNSDLMDLQDSALVVVTYQAVVRLLLVILHDFSDFYVLHHQYLVDALPRNAIQLRNFVISAVPKGLLLPNPLSPELKVDLLPEIATDPPYSYDASLDYTLPPKLQQQVAAMMAGQAEIDGRIFVDNNAHFGRLILALAQSSLRRYSAGFNGADVFSSKALALVKSAAACLSAESRYDMFNVIIDQLRYPNRHTHFFSCLLLALFIDSDDRSLKEHITRILLERLIVHRPHPWGIMITFIELVKNARYHFWDMEFTKSTPEIEKMFATVAKSCLMQS